MRYIDIMKTIQCAVFCLVVSSFAFSRNIMSATREQSPTDYEPFAFPVLKEDLTSGYIATDSTSILDDLVGLARMKNLVSTQSSKPHNKDKSNEVLTKFQEPSLLEYQSTTSPIQGGIEETHIYSNPPKAKATSSFSGENEDLIFSDYQEGSTPVISGPSQLNINDPSDTLFSRQPATENNHKESSDTETNLIANNALKSENSITKKHIASSTPSSTLKVKENNNDLFEDHSLLLYPTVKSTTKATAFDIPRHQTQQHMETTISSISARFSATENVNAFPDVKYSMPFHPTVESTTKVRISDKLTKQWIKNPKRASNSRYSSPKNEQMLPDFKHASSPIYPEQSRLHSTTSVPMSSGLLATENKNAPPPDFGHYLLPYSLTESSSLSDKIVDNTTPQYIQRSTPASRSVFTKDDITPLPYSDDSYSSNVLLVSSIYTTTPVITPDNPLSTGPTHHIPVTSTDTKNYTEISTNANPTNTTNEHKNSLEISAKDVIMVIIGDFQATEPDSRKNSTSGIEEKGYKSGELFDIRFITDYASRDCSAENYCYFYGECRECS